MEASPPPPFVDSDAGFLGIDLDLSFQVMSARVPDSGERSGLDAPWPCPLRAHHVRSGKAPTTLPLNRHGKFAE